MKHICATLLLLCSPVVPDYDIQFVERVKTCALEYNSILEPVDRIPINLLLAQAIHESGWGKSRFARKGHNLFGIKAVDDESFMWSSNMQKVKTYRSDCESVEDYIDLLSFGKPYVEFKSELTKQWVNDNVNVYLLVDYLDDYAEDEQYEEKIKKIIMQLEKSTFLSSSSS